MPLSPNELSGRGLEIITGRRGGREQGNQKAKKTRENRKERNGRRVQLIL
jgi:hypothetical protein